MSDSPDLDESPCGPDLPQEFYNDLLCPICLEFFKSPIILPCSHVLCRSPCAENLFDFNFIRCPVCRENCYVSGGIGSLPRVIPLESIIEKYRSERRKVIQNARRAQKKAAHGLCAAHKTQGVNSCARNPALSNGVCAHDVVPSSSGDAQNAQSSHACAHDAQSSFASAHNAQNGHVYAQEALNPSINARGVLSGNEISSSGACSETPSLWQQRHHRSTSATLASSVCSSASPVSEILPLSPRSNGQHFARTEQFQRNSLLSLSSTPRNVDRFDASLFDVSTDSVTSCSRHGSEASVYCQMCERCVCDVCGDADHVTTHVTNSVDDAALQAKGKLTQNLEKMNNSQKKVMTSLDQQRQCLKDMEQAFHRKTEEINMQCDSLLAEVEHKRSLFLADLDQEERVRRSEVDDIIEIMEKILGTSQSLAEYTTDILDKDAASVLQVTPALNEQLLGSLLDCEACQSHPDDLHPDLLPGKVIDLRKEQTFLRDIHYLDPPAPPTIDLSRCARSENTVALFVSPSRYSDVIDSFVIRYCTEDQKALGIEETLTLDHSTSASADLPQWRTSSHLHSHPTAHESSHQGGSPSLMPLVVLLQGLRPGTPYLFCVSAANRAGGSTNSEVVRCVTLTSSHSVVPVPVILEGMCHTYPSSIRLYTPSPHDVAPEQNISHFLLFRPHSDRHALWRCLPLCGRAESRVFGLEPGAVYEFVVMATNPRGECQISQLVVLETDSAAVS